MSKANSEAIAKSVCLVEGHDLFVTPTGKVLCKKCGTELEDIQQDEKQ